MIVKNDLFDYENRYIYQNNEMFKFSLDSILLAEYSKLKTKDKIIIDMCAGNMVVPLILSCKYKNNITGFEIQKEIFKMGKDSIILNNMEKQLNIINDDINNINNYYDKESVDVFICNPPYFKTTNDKLTNEKKELSLARHEITLNLEQIFLISNKYLKNKGILYLVHRPERLDEIIVLANKHNVNVKNIQFISTKKGDKPKLILIKCMKNSSFGVKINNEICIEKLNTYKNIFEEK